MKLVLHFPKSILLHLMLSLVCLSAGSQSLANPLAQHTIWLMGEVHDNAQGHLLRQQLLQQALEQGWRPSLVLEQLDKEQQKLATEAFNNCSNANCFIEKLNQKNWDWALYKGLIELAYQYKLIIVAGNLSRQDASAVMKQGFKASLPATLIDALKLETELPTTILNAQIKAVDEGHCGQMPAQFLNPMAKAQIARDVWMAYTLEQALVQNPKGVVLIAGNGHTRKDIGVKQWLKPHLQDSTISYGFLENLGTQDSSLYDRVINIPPITRPDLCEQFKKPTT